MPATAFSSPGRAPAAPAPGFADPVHDAQQTFRALLDAMSRPGTVAELPVLPEAGGLLTPEALAVLLALADLDTPVWLRPGLADESDRAFLRFHCGCPLADDPGAARFAVVGPNTGADELRALHLGSAEYPDRSATVVVQVDDLRVPGAGEGGGLRLTGPGIDGEARLAVSGPGPQLWEFARENRALFPLGLDFILVAPGRAACLPRSASVEGLACT